MFQNNDRAHARWSPNLCHHSRAGATSLTVTFACQQCGAGLAFEGLRTETCPYCASPSVIERPARSGQPNPAFAVAFTGDAGWASDRLASLAGAAFDLCRSRPAADPRRAHARCVSACIPVLRHRTLGLHGPDRRALQALDPVPNAATVRAGPLITSCGASCATTTSSTTTMHPRRALSTSPTRPSHPRCGPRASPRSLHRRSRRPRR